MCNLYTKFVRFLEICKHFSNGLVTEKGNILRPGPVPRFSDLEVIALSMAAESEEIDSENWLFESKLKECRSKLPNLISRRQFNDRRKSVSNLQEEIRSRMAKEMDGGEDFVCIDSKPIEVCRIPVVNVVRWELIVIMQKHRTSDIVHLRASTSLVISFMHFAV